MKIEINTDNPRVFYKIALFIDRDDFQKHVDSIRKAHKIETLLTPKQYNTLYLNWKKEYPANLESKKNIAEMMTDIWNGDNTKGARMFQSIFLVSIPIQKLFLQNSLIIHIIPQIILMGKFQLEKNFNVTRLMSLSDHDLPHLDILEEEEYAVVINSHSTLDEVKSLYHNAKKLLPKKPDTISNFERNRNWYWENKMGKSVEKIYKGLGDNPGITVKGIEAAISDYKKRLNTPIVLP